MTKEDGKIVIVLKKIRQDLKDRLSEEMSEYHISDIGIGIEISLKILEKYLKNLEGKND